TARGVTPCWRAASSRTAPGFSAMKRTSSGLGGASMCDSGSVREAWESVGRTTTLGHRGLGAQHGLLDLEAFEFRMFEIGRAGGLVASARVRDAKSLGLGPGLKHGLALPDRMRRVECMVLALRTLEQVELDKARHLLQLRVAVEPDLLECLLRTFLHTEPIH